MRCEIRPAAVAGSFYPASPSELTATVDDLLRVAVGTTKARLQPPKALIVPHAGLRYSGAIAASAYACVAPFADRIRRVLIFGPSHRAYFRGLALPEAGAFATPIGVVSIDTDAILRLSDVPRLAAAHAREHSIEVQVPFLQRALGGITIVPIVAGDAHGDEVAKVMDALWGGPETLIVVSSDLSHFLPYAEAKRVDEETAQRIEALSEEPIVHERACGATPVNGLSIVARRRGLCVSRLDLRNSGDTAGSRDQVVGYGAFAFDEETRDR